MKILFSGSRLTLPEFEPLLAAALDEWDPARDTVIHGGAPGVDSIVDKLAKLRGFKVIKKEADWRRLGARAGPLRNQAMIDMKPNVVYVLPYPSLEESKGTRDTYRRAQKKKIRTVVLK